MLDKYRVPLAGRDQRSFYPEKSTIQTGDGFYDTDGAALQSEPAIQFLKYSLRTLESPYWNPYSGAGVVGPETLVDIKFSPLTVATALLGGSLIAFHAVSLMMFTFAIYFLSLACTQFWGISRKATMAVGYAYMLNGYVTANLSSNTNQAYFYFPLVMYATLRLSRMPSLRNFVIATVVYVFPLLVTFFPTTTLMVGSALVLALASIFETNARWQVRLKLMVAQIMAPIVAVLSLAFLYLPIVETMQINETLRKFEERQFHPANWRSIIAFFTPKSFFESYAAIDTKLGGYMPNVVFHFGILVGIFFVLAFGRKFFREFVLMTATVLLSIALARIFGMPMVGHLIDSLPFFGRIGEQYWWIVVACSTVVVFAHGVRAFERADYMLWPSAVIALVILSSLIYVGVIYGFPSAQNSAPIGLGRALYYVIRVVVTVAFGIWMLFEFKKPMAQRAKLMTYFVFAVFFELIFYMNSTRVIRTDLFADPPNYIQFIKENIGLQRTATYGEGGLPAEVGSAFQIQQIEFFGMNLSPSYFALCQRGLTTEHGWQGNGLCANRDTTHQPNIDETLLNMLSVRYIMVTRWMPQFAKFFNDRGYPHAFETVNITVFENKNAFPRAYGLNNLMYAPETPETRGYSAKSIAFTEDSKFVEQAREKGIGIGSTEPSVSPDFNKVQIQTYHHTAVKMIADFSKPGVVVLPDNWHPNWTAFVDGVPSYLAKVNQTFRGVAITEGRHVIEMYYRPKSLVMGFIISAITILFLAIAFFVAPRFRYPRR
jgi:hypothetical protein